MDQEREYKRCAWSGHDPLYIAYHDEEWGVPVHDDIKLFEMLVLDGAQAGLSWLTTRVRRNHGRVPPHGKPATIWDKARKKGPGSIYSDSPNKRMQPA